MEDELPSKPTEPSTITITSTDEKPYFYASGQLAITLEHGANCGFIQMLNYVTKEKLLTLSSSKDEGENTRQTESLAEEWYYITSSGNCIWSADITGNVTAPASSSEPDPETGDCNCLGCCSSHGGVICYNDTTMCGDGTPLSDTCRNKGCKANGCPDCE